MLVTVPCCLARRLVHSKRKTAAAKDDIRVAAPDQRDKSIRPKASSSDNLWELIIGRLGCVFVVDMTKKLIILGKICR